MRLCRQMKLIEQEKRKKKKYIKLLYFKEFIDCNILLGFDVLPEINRQTTS